jgi:hypothetical protein
MLRMLAALRLEQIGWATIGLAGFVATARARG